MIDDPINAANGNMVHHETDVAFPAIAGALDIVRSWNSLLADVPGAFGPGWSSALDVRLAVDPGHVTATLAGRQPRRLRRVAGWLVGSRRPAVELTHDADGWVLRIDLVPALAAFEPDGRLTGWHAGVARVAVRRDGSTGSSASTRR